MDDTANEERACTVCFRPRSSNPFAICSQTFAMTIVGLNNISLGFFYTRWQKFITTALHELKLCGQSNC